MFKIADFKIAVFFLICASVFGFLLVPTIEEEWSHSPKGKGLSYTSYTLGPRFFPYLSASLMGLLSLLLLVKSLRSKKRHTEENKLPRPKSEFQPVLVFMATGTGYIAFLSYLGVALATPLCLLALFWYFGLRKWSWILLLTIGVTIFIYAIFEKLMGIPLPQGILGRLWSFS